MRSVQSSLCLRGRVAAALDDRGDLGPEPLVDLAERAHAAAVLDDVVQQRGDRRRLVAAVLEHERADREQMREVRDRRALAHILRVVGAGVLERLA